MGKNREKFIELAEKRVSKAIKNIRLIGNLANKSNYSYTDDQVKKILNALDKELKNLKKRFETTVSDEDFRFKF